MLASGARAFVARRARQGRRTDYDLVLMDAAGVLVGVDSRLPNQLILEALLDSKLPLFEGYTQIAREPRLPGSRVDFLLVKSPERCLIEVKSVALVIAGEAFFPDAPTPRGTKHLELLREAARGGRRAAVLFVIQREDAVSFSPHGSLDPVFALILQQAVGEGVEAHAYNCKVTLEEINLAAEIPVTL